MVVLEGVDYGKLSNSILVKSKFSDMKTFLYSNGVLEKIRWVPTPESRLYGEIGNSNAGSLRYKHRLWVQIIKGLDLAHPGFGCFVGCGQQKIE